MSGPAGIPSRLNSYPEPVADTPGKAVAVADPAVRRLPWAPVPAAHAGMASSPCPTLQARFDLVCDALERDRQNLRRHYVDVVVVPEQSPSIAS
ncbi:MAG: hypothetical protein M3457_01710 [Chloroflexota bacterium]|nr:hypothetical protein [Chloroflexota bacterium]